MKLLLWHQYDDARLQVLRQNLSDDWEILRWRESDGEARLAQLRNEVDAIVSMFWSRDNLPAENMKLIHLPGAGLDGIDFSAVPNGCKVCNVYEHEIGIAEYCVASMLSWEIGLSQMQSRMRQGDWTGSFVLNDGTHGELFAKTVGFVGYGRIAMETAKRLRPFGVKILARTRTPSKTDDSVDEIAAIDELDSMLERCDYLIVSCPLTDETRGIINRPAFEKLKDTAVVINVGRGPVIDEEALYLACRDRVIAGAIIDTWYQYPTSPDEACWPSRYAFHLLDNVKMTPHASGWSAGLFPRRWSIIAENLNRLSAGSELINLASSSD